MKRELIAATKIKKKLFSASVIVTLLCWTPMFVMWTSVQGADLADTLDFYVFGDFKGKGNCLQASSGTIDAWLPNKYGPWMDDKSVGAVTWELSYGYDFASSPGPTLVLVEDVMVHIHVAGSFRRLDLGESADISMLMIGGCTVVDPDGAQYCVNAYSEGENIGVVTRDDQNAWSVVASISSSGQGPPVLCVNRWDEGNVVDGFCIPLSFDLTVIGTITK